MSKPNINIPAEFAVNGVKTPFSNAKVQNGFDRINPDVLAGDNLNQFIDDTYKGLNGVLELYEGCVLYDSTVTYNNTSIVFYINADNEVEVYRSLINNNLNNPLTDTTAWEQVKMGGGNGYEVGDIVIRITPTNDAGKHLLDGALIQGSGIYGEFVQHIADLYAENPTANYFTDETSWQTAVTTYGVCGKFVYDSVNNTVRLPKYSNKIYTQDIEQNDAPVIGNGMTLGLTNGTENGGLFYTSGIYKDIYGLAPGISSATQGIAETSVGVTTDSTKSGLIAQLSDITTSLEGYYYIVIATSTKTDIQVDIDEIATDLNGKADIDLSNINPTQNVKNTIVGWGMPDYSAGVSVSTSTYIAQSNGIIGFYQKQETNNKLSFAINGSKVVQKPSGQYSGLGFCGEILVSANDSIVINNLTYMTVTFYPMKGVN